MTEGTLVRENEMDQRKAVAKNKWPAAAGLSVCGRNVRAGGVLLFMTRCRRESLKLQLLKSAVRRRDVNVAFRIGRHVVATSQHARAADGLHNLERLAGAHAHFLCPS